MGTQGVLCEQSARRILGMVSSGEAGIHVHQGNRGGDGAGTVTGDCRAAERPD